MIGKIPWFLDYLWRAFIIPLVINPSCFSDVDIIVSTSPLLPDVIVTAFFSAILDKAKPIIYHHGFVTPLMLSKYNFIQRFLAVSIQRKFLTWILRKFSFTFFALPTAREDLLILGTPKEIIKDMVNGIDIKVIDDIKAKKKLFDGIFMGSIIPGKGILDLPEIWRNVVDVFPKARLAILGTGPHKFINKLKKEIKERNIEKNIVLLGSILGPRKYVLLKSSKVFVFPSYSENWPISVMEAMYCSLPCVVYSLKAYDIFGDGIIRITPGDKKKFADAIIKLLSDEKLRMMKGKTVKRMVSRFNWDEIALKHESDLERVLK